MSVKVLVVLSLFAMASASPTATLKLPFPTSQSDGILSIGSYDLGVGLGSLLKNIIGSKHTARKSLTTILAMKIKDWNSVCDFSTQVVVSLCDTVEASYKGLGSLLSRLIIYLIRIIICFLGKGGGNPVCSNNINALVGVSVTGSADIQALIKLYDLVDCQDKVNAIITLYTKGRGISRCKGSVKVIFKIALELAQLVQISVSGKLTKAHLSICFRKITILIGVIGNSRKNGLGISITKNYVATCNKYMKAAGYTEITITEEDQNDIDSANDDNGPWRVSDTDGDDNSVSVGVCGLIGNLFKGLIGVTRLATNLIKDILGLVIKSAEDVFTLIIKIALGLGGVLDATCSGLGSLLVRIVAGLLKMNLCFKGTSKYGVCKSGWDRQFQVTEEVTSVDLVIKFYGLGSCRSQVDTYISTYIKTRGEPTGSLKLLFDFCFTLSDICDSRKWDKTVIVTIVKIVISSMGAIGNSNSKGVGTSICNKVIPQCKKYLAVEGFEDIDIDIKTIDACNEDDNNWCSDIDTSDGKTGWIIGGGGGVVVSGGGGGGIGGIIKGIFGTIKGVTKIVGGVLDNLLNIKINALKDVFTLVLNLSLVLQVTLNNLVLGLGSLFVRIVACTIKIAVCIKGCPGDKGICTKDWNKNFGIIGDASTISELIVLFKLTKCQDEYNTYVSKCTRGKGISSTKGSIRSVLVKLKIFIDIIMNADNITNDTVTDIIVYITTICGCIGNSQKKDSGKDITREVIPKCGPVLKEAGYKDITINITIVEKECAESNNDNCDWNGGDNGGTTPSPGGDTTPTTVGDTTPTPGSDTTPTTVGDTTPVTVGDTTPTPGGDTTPTPGGDTTPTPGGYTSPTPGDTTTTGDTGTTPSGGDTTGTTPGYTTGTTPGDTYGTTPGDTTGTTPKDTTGTTPTPAGDTTPTSGPTTTPSPGGDTTPGGDTITPGGDTTTPSGGDTTPSPGGGDDCGSIIGGAIKVIPGCTKLSTTNLIKQIIEIKIRAFIDVVNLICKLTLSLGGIIDLFVTGLGSIFTRIVAVIYKIGVCVHGWGDKTICTKEWNAQFGVNGDANTPKDLIDLYRLQNCRSDVTTIITNYSGSKDYTKETDIISVILQRVDGLTTIVVSEEITKEHFSACFVHVISIFGCIINSYSKGSGTKITQKIIPICGPYFVKQGCPNIVEQKTKIITVISAGDDAKIDWKTIETKANSGDLTTDVKDAFKGVKDSKDKASYNAVFNLEIPRSFDGCLSFIIKVIQALGAILDLFISGLGTLLVRIVGCLINYIVAILGKSRNSKSFVCQKAYYDSFGVAVSGGEWNDLVTGFKVGKCKSDLDNIKAVYTKSKGTLNVVEILFFECGYSLVAIVTKGPKIEEGDLCELFRLVTTLLCGFANSCSPNLGKRICDSFVPVCSSFLEKNNYPALTTHSKTISKSIDGCNNVSVSWVTKTTVEN